LIKLFPSILTIASCESHAALGKYKFERWYWNGAHVEEIVASASLIDYAAFHAAVEHTLTHG
jgi:hypothetical protein